MDYQRVDRESSAGVKDNAPEAHRQFSLRSIFVVTSWASLWMGAWAVINYYNNHNPPTSAPIVLMYAILFVIVTCPLAVFGYMVSRAKLGIIVGLVTSALVVILGLLTLPHVR
jgi:amino acid permease